MWFKKRYVDDIMQGTKTDTIRVASSRLPRVGEVVPFSVGPIRPFAFARITDVCEVQLADLDAERAADVRAMVDADKPLVRISFVVLSDHADAPQMR